MGITANEQRVLDAIDEGQPDLIELASELIRFDTTTRDGIDSPPRQEVALQEYLAKRLRYAGAKTELWEPSKQSVAGSRQIPAGLRFIGFPQLVARFQEPAAVPA